MKNPELKKIKGYIEGYYGKLLSWDNRNKIINQLAKNKMNYYFYCPKEDVHQRIEWRKPYNKNWLSKFNEFVSYAHKKNIKIIAGISPGLDFDFRSFVNGSNKDYNYLKSKIKALINSNVDHISILFDDIPDNFKFRLPEESEGKIHGEIINKIISDLKKPIFAVPRIYSDELIVENPNYLKDFFEFLNEDVFVFFTGKYIVSKSFLTNSKFIKKRLELNKIVYWDNFYANDYCPKRLIIGPWQNRNLINKSMINGTGMIETDKLIIEIVNRTSSSKNKFSTWKKVLKNNHVHSDFFTICKPFLSPNFSYEKTIKYFKPEKEHFMALDTLLWKWKNNLSREWYAFFLNYKHDLQLYNKKLTFNRILKTQTSPMCNFILKRR